MKQDHRLARDLASNADAACVASATTLVPTKPSDILSAAADLIEPEGRWTQGFAARSANGKEVLPRSDKATCWCVFGAVMKVTRSDYVPINIVDHIAASTGSMWVASWNDAKKRTQPEVVSALRQAAEKARDSGQ